MSTKRIIALERELTRMEKEFRSMIGASVDEIESLKRSLEKLKAAGTVVPEPPAPAGKLARIPARPEIMKEAGVGKDPKR